jgi:hypothetical protein
MPTPIPDSNDAPTLKGTLVAGSSQTLPAIVALWEILPPKPSSFSFRLETPLPPPAKFRLVVISVLSPNSRVRSTSRPPWY